MNTDWRKQTEQLAELIRHARHTVFFGGAGVSTASGVPDFRSATGIYRREIGAEEILTPGFLRGHPEAFYDFYRKYFILDGIKPNACHLVLADLEKRGLLKAVVTQNVDHLHQDAGSRTVYELHGTGNQFSCTRCGSVYPLSEVRGMEKVPHCSCGGMLRPDIVLYEEGLDQDVLWGAVTEIKKSDLLIIGGTSLRVYPAAGLIHYQKPSGKKVLIDLNPGVTEGVNLVIQANIAEVFAYLEECLREEKGVSDPFYSESNISHLKKVLKDVESGDAHFEEHNLIEED